MLSLPAAALLSYPLSSEMTLYYIIWISAAPCLIWRTASFQHLSLLVLLSLILETLMMWRAYLSEGLLKLAYWVRYHQHTQIILEEKAKC